MLRNLSGVWQRANLTQRVMLTGILAGCVVAAALLVNWARKPNMALLYSGLDRGEAARIVEKIRDAGVAYELKDGGTTVYVDEEEVYSLRLQMASLGLPAGEQMGYSILDEESFGSSPFKQQVNYKRALEGELAKSIQLIDGIVSARVHIVKPKGTVLSKKTKGASATVMVRLKPGKRLTSSNVSAIVHLVAGGVEELSPQNVAVVDSNGTLLTAGEDNSLAKRAATFLEYKAQVEEYLARKADTLLAAALGPNRASVRVNAVIDTSSVSMTTETYDPEKKVVTREEIKSSSSSPAAGKSGGSAGASQSEETTSTDYLVAKTVQTQTDLPGDVKSLSVAVFVDLSDQAGGADGAEGGAGEAKIKPEDVKKIVKAALGLNLADGGAPGGAEAGDFDTLEVIEASFPQPAAPEELQEPGMFSLDNILKLLKQASLGILVIGALFILKMFGGKKAAAGEESAALEGLGAGGGNLLPAPESRADQEMLKARITRALQNNPDEVKRLFLSWVEGEKGQV